MTGRTGTTTPGTVENPGRGAAIGKKSIAGKLHGNVPMHAKNGNIGLGGTRRGSIEFGPKSRTPGPAMRARITAQSLTATSPEPIGASSSYVPMPLLTEAAVVTSTSRRAFEARTQRVTFYLDAGTDFAITRDQRTRSYSSAGLIWI
jgi:hypothetical protein